MNNTMFHRGPDDEGYLVDGNFGFAQRRLAIIDLVKGVQPIYNEDRAESVICNGEIYNYKDIRKELGSNGHKFTTNSDTEVIVHLYEEMGLDFASKLEGMFAIALWDSRERKLILCRDRTGIKPLFYYLDESKLVFASELKSILLNKELDLDINMEALCDYLCFGYIPGPKSIFGKINKLEPGELMVVNEQGKAAHKRYWVLDCNDTVILSKSETVKRAYELIENAVKSQLVSDVPFGVFLSGGIDSSIVAAMMAKNLREKLKTFSIGFETSEYNELDRARIVAESIDSDHHEFIVSPDIESTILKLSEQYDEPFADPSAIPTYFVSKMAARHVKMCLSGDGGDELFGGYRRYGISLNHLWYDNIPTILKDIAGVLSNKMPFGMKGKVKLNALSLNRYERYVAGLCICNADTMRLLLRKHLFGSMDRYTSSGNLTAKFRNGFDFVNQMGMVDFKTYLVDNNLQKVDRASTLNSLEVRVPFLDRKVIEYAYSIPGHMKIENGNLKAILKKVAKMVLPSEITKYPKKGFSVPIKYWLRNELNGFLRDIIFSRDSFLADYCNAAFVKDIYEMHTRGDVDYSRLLWSIMNLELWARNYYGKN